MNRRSFVGFSIMPKVYAMVTIVLEKINLVADYLTKRTKLLESIDIRLWKIQRTLVAVYKELQKTNSSLEDLDEDIEKIRRA